MKTAEYLIAVQHRCNSKYQRYIKPYMMTKRVSAGLALSFFLLFFSCFFAYSDGRRLRNYYLRTQ